MPTVKKTITKTTKTATKPAVKKPHSANLPAGKAGATAAKENPKNTGGFAIIETGGKQYRVAVGDSIKIEKLASAAKKELTKGGSVIFDKILLVDNGKDATDIGTPYIAEAKVSGTLTEVGRSKKVTVIKYKSKSRYLKKQGHRQSFFRVRIDKIS